MIRTQRTTHNIHSLYGWHFINELKKSLYSAVVPLIQTDGSNIFHFAFFFLIISGVFVFPPVPAHRRFLLLMILLNGLLFPFSYFDVGFLSEFPSVFFVCVFSLFSFRFNLITCFQSIQTNIAI